MLLTRDDLGEVARKPAEPKDEARLLSNNSWLMAWRAAPINFRERGATPMKIRHGPRKALACRAAASNAFRPPALLPEIARTAKKSACLLSRVLPRPTTDEIRDKLADQQASGT